MHRQPRSLRLFSRSRASALCKLDMADGDGSEPRPRQSTADASEGTVTCRDTRASACPDPRSISQTDPLPEDLSSAGSAIRAARISVDIKSGAHVANAGDPCAGHAIMRGPPIMRDHSGYVCGLRAVAQRICLALVRWGRPVFSGGRLPQHGCSCPQRAWRSAPRYIRTPPLSYDWSYRDQSIYIQGRPVASRGFLAGV